MAEPPLPPEVASAIIPVALLPYHVNARQHAERVWTSFHTAPRPSRPWTMVDEENSIQWIILVFRRALYQQQLYDAPISKAGDRPVLSPVALLVGQMTEQIDKLHTTLLFGIR